MSFYYVYVLQSLKFDWIYVGSSADLRTRFKNHNDGENLSTKGYKPFNLIFYEAYLSKKDALRREEYFKTTKGKTTLRTMLKEYFKNK
ncbi:MAG: GIY-YIG nuclease family protein [Patescibacteria group bacterium]